METQYRLPTGKDWYDTNPESLALIHQEAQRAHEERLSYFYRLQDKTFRYIGLLTPLVGILIALFSGVLGSADQLEKFPPVLWINFALLFLVLASCLVLLSLNLFTVTMATNGMPPRKLVREYHLFTTDAEGFDAARQSLTLRRELVEMLQTAIEENSAVIAKRDRLLSGVLRAVGISLAVTGAVLVLVLGVAWGAG